MFIDTKKEHNARETLTVVHHIEGSIHPDANGTAALRTVLLIDVLLLLF